MPLKYESNMIFTCDKCGKVEIKRETLGEGDIVFTDLYPDGWTVVKTPKSYVSSYYCPNHKVEIR